MESNRYLPTLLKNKWIVETDSGYEITPSGMEFFIVYADSINHGNVGGATFLTPDETYDALQEILIKKNYLCVVWDSETHTTAIRSTKNGKELFESMEFYLDKKKQLAIQRQQKAQKIMGSVIKGIADITMAMGKLSNSMEPKKTRGKRKTKHTKKRKPRRQKDNDYEPYFGNSNYFKFGLT